MDDITQLTQHATDAVKAEAKNQAQAAIGAIALESRALATALQGAADQAQRDGARMVQEPLRQLAGACQRFADKSGDQGIRDVFAAVEDFGRRQPLALLGAATAVGFLGTRALRASAGAKAAQPQEDRSQQLPQNGEDRSAGEAPTDTGVA